MLDIEKSLNANQKHAIILVAEHNDCSCSRKPRNLSALFTQRLHKSTISKVTSIYSFTGIIAWNTRIHTRFIGRRRVLLTTFVMGCCKRFNVQWPSPSSSTSIDGLCLDCSLQASSEKENTVQRLPSTESGPCWFTSQSVVTNQELHHGN